MICDCAAVPTMSHQEISLAARRASDGGEGVEQLLKREKVLVARVMLENGESVIVKLWSGLGIRGLLRRMTGTSNMQAEWRTLRHLYGAGVAVPRPLGRCWARDGHYTDAILIEDLGKCTLGLTHVKSMLREGRDAEHEQFVTKLMEMTQLILDQGIVDPDHGLQNILVRANGEPVRIDFELARISRSVRWRRKQYGNMIGRLLTTYVFAAQPDMMRIKQFAQRLRTSLSLPPGILQRAGEYAQEQMAKQLVLKGIDTRLELEW